MFGGQQLGPQVLRCVESWVPEKAYRKESRFQDDLKEYLEHQLNSSGGPLGPNRTHSVRKERGKARADLAIDDQVGIELKREVKNSGLRRLRDQIHDYRDEYPFVIVCACGLQETGKWNELKQEYEGQQGLGFDAGATIRFVEKVKDGRTFSGGGRGGGDSGLFGGGFDLGLD